MIIKKLLYPIAYMIAWLAGKCTGWLGNVLVDRIPLKGADKIIYHIVYLPIRKILYGIVNMYWEGE